MPAEITGTPLENLIDRLLTGEAPSSACRALSIDLEDYGYSIISSATFRGRVDNVIQTLTADMLFKLRAGAASGSTECARVYLSIWDPFASSSTAAAPIP